MKIERTAFGKNVAALEAKESRLSQVSKEGQAHYLDETTDFDLTPLKLHLNECDDRMRAHNYFFSFFRSWVRPTGQQPYKLTSTNLFFIMDFWGSKAIHSLSL